MFKHLIKLLYAVVTDGIASISLKEILQLAVTMTLAEKLEMVVIASGITIPMKDHAEETPIVVMLHLAILTLLVELDSHVSSTHVVVPLVSVSQFVPHKFIMLIQSSLYY